MGKGNGLKALEQFNRFYLHNQLKREKEIKDYTLDIPVYPCPTAGGQG